jgi:ABC-type thiamine transport system ATPase subunit
VEILERICNISMFSTAARELGLDDVSYQRGALDAITKEELQEELLQIWNTQKCTVLMITHDIDEALNIDFLYNRFAHDDDEVA